MSTDGEFEPVCDCGCGCQDEAKLEKKLQLPFLDLIHKFVESHKEKCSYLELMETKMIPKHVQKLYSTGTTYEGMSNMIGMTVYGTYTMPHGVAYKGELDEEGMFHGEGELIYPSGNVLRGKWEHGNFVGKRQLFFNDYIVFLEDNWTYCHMPDRRFAIELVEGLQPAGDSFLSASQPSREVPDAYYDCGEGFYLPSYRCIYSHDDITKIIVSPPVEEQKWILRNCRKSPDLPVGPIPDFYETYYKPTPLLDPTWKGDSYQSPADSCREEVVSTLSTASAAQRWNRYHLLSLDSWLERAAQYYRSSIATSADSAMDTASGSKARNTLQSIHRSASFLDNLDPTTELARRLITDAVEKSPERQQSTEIAEDAKTPSISSDNRNTDQRQSMVDQFAGRTKRDTINLFRRSSSVRSGKLPVSSLKVTQSNTSLENKIRKSSDKNFVEKLGSMNPIFEINIRSLLNIKDTNDAEDPSSK